jgi:hypothetical protein
MGIIKLEVSLPEAVQAIEEFRRHRIKAFDAIATEVKAAVSSALNQLLHSEMTVFLGKPEQSGNKRNGYQEREYARLPSASATRSASGPASEIRE